MIGTVIWLTGIPCSGKTTLGEFLMSRVRSPVFLDGDRIRREFIEHGELGFSAEDRRRNVLMAGEKAVGYAEMGHDVIVALVSPYEKDRNAVREMHRGPFVLVHVDCPREVCIRRDVKGMWAKAMRGEIRGFTGWDDPYEPPSNPDVKLDTSKMSVDECADTVLRVYEERSRVLLYIGRWQPFHRGHQALIDACLGEHRNVVVGIRDTPKTSADPYNFEDRRRMIEAVYWKEPLVSVFPVPFPNIKSINIGRGVGYEIRTVEVEGVSEVSGTEIRKRLKTGVGAEEMVPEEVAMMNKSG